MTRTSSGDSPSAYVAYIVNMKGWSLQYAPYLELRLGSQPIAAYDHITMPSVTMAKICQVMRTDYDPGHYSNYSAYGSDDPLNTL